MTAERHAPTTPTAQLELLRPLAWLTILALLALVVKHNALIETDFIIAGWIAATRSPQLGDVAHALAVLGDAGWVVAVLALMSLWSWRRPGWAAVLWFAFVLGFLIQVGLRLWVAQWRPDVLSVPTVPSWFDRFNLAGFTSGHAFRATFLFGLWAEWLGQRRHMVGRWTCLLAIALVGWTRLYLDRHWCSDVVGGWILAAAMLAWARWMRVNWLKAK